MTKLTKNNHSRQDKTLQGGTGQKSDAMLSIRRDKTADTFKEIKK